jgi:recombination protein RecT
MTQVAVQKTPEFITMLDKSRKEIEKALPSIMSSERFIRMAITEIRKSDKLMECSPMSLISCSLQAAQLGLEFGSSLGEIYLVPYGKEATIQVGYKGLLTLARRSGEIVSIDAAAVYENDHFECEKGDNPSLRHKMVFPRTKPVLYYAIAKLKSGAINFEVMEIEEIEYIRDTYSKAADKDAWKKSFSEMAKKTVLRRLMKILPKSTELIDAIAIEDQHSTIEHTERRPELLAAVSQGQMHPSVKEHEHAFNELMASLMAAEKLGIDTSDFPSKELSEYSTQEVFACLEILRTRIAERKAKDGSR